MHTRNQCHLTAGCYECNPITGYIFVEHEEKTPIRNSFKVVGGGRTEATKSFEELKKERFNF